MPHSRPRAVKMPSGAWHVIANGSHSCNMLVFLLQACSTSGQRCIVANFSNEERGTDLRMHVSARNFLHMPRPLPQNHVHFSIASCM